QPGLINTNNAFAKQLVCAGSVAASKDHMLSTGCKALSESNEFRFIIFSDISFAFQKDDSATAPIKTYEINKGFHYNVEVIKGKTNKKLLVNQILFLSPELFAICIVRHVLPLL